MALKVLKFLLASLKFLNCYFCYCFCRPRDHRWSEKYRHVSPEPFSQSNKSNPCRTTYQKNLKYLNVGWNRKLQEFGRSDWVRSKIGNQPTHSVAGAIEYCFGRVRYLITIRAKIIGARGYARLIVVKFIAPAGS